MNIGPRLGEDGEPSRKIVPNVLAVSSASSKSNCDQDCDPESLVSGLVFSLSERRSSIGNRLAPDGTEAGQKGQIEKAVSPSTKETYDTIRHSVAPPDTPIKEPAKRRAKLEAGGISPPRSPRTGREPLDSSGSW